MEPLFVEILFSGRRRRRFVFYYRSETVAEELAA